VARQSCESSRLITYAPSSATVRDDTINTESLANRPHPASNTCRAFHFAQERDEFESRNRRSEAGSSCNNIVDFHHDQQCASHAYTIARMMTHNLLPAGEQSAQRARSKREQVLVACKICRGRKTKVRCVVKPISAIAQYCYIVMLTSILTSSSV